MGEVIELIYGRNEAESFENSKKVEEWILAGQGEFLAEQGGSPLLPPCPWGELSAAHSCHSSPMERGWICVGDTSSLERLWEATGAPGVFHVEMVMALGQCGFGLVGRMGLDRIEASCKEQCGCMARGGVSVFMGTACSPLQVWTEMLWAKIPVALACAPGHMKKPRTRPLLLPLTFLSVSNCAAPVIW